MKYAQIIKDLRKQYGMSQKYLGGLLGVSAQAVAKWEKGYSEPSITYLMKMSTLFNCSVDYLLGRSVGITSIREKDDLSIMLDALNERQKGQVKSFIRGMLYEAKVDIDELLKRAR